MTGAHRTAIARVRERLAAAWRCCRSDLAAAAALLAPLLVVFRRMFQGQAIEAMDFLTWTLPSRSLWRSAVLEGRLPQWNPLSDLGAPTIYAPVHGVLYPGNALLFFGPLPFALSFMFVAHLLLAGLGGYRLARRLGCGAASSLCAGFAWELGYQVWMWGCGEKVLSGAWVPWTALGLISAVRAASARSLAILGAAVALAMVALAGDPFLWLHAIPLGLVIAWATDERPARVLLLRLLGRTALVVGLAMVMAAPQLLPSALMLHLTSRAGGLTRAVAERWSLEPHRLADILTPGMFGSGADDEWCAFLYFGMAPALGALLAGRSRVVAALWGLALAALLLALGRYTPVHEIARRVFPPLAYLRYPAKHGMVLQAALVCLGALGIQRLLDRKVRMHWLAIPLALSALVWLVIHHSTPAHETGPGHAALAAGAFMIGLALARWKPRLEWLLPLGMALELVLFVSPQFRWITTDVVRTPPRVLAPVFAANQVPPLRVLVEPSVQTPLPPNTGYLFNVGHLYAHETARLAHVERLLDAFAHRRATAASLLDASWQLRASGVAGDGETVMTLPEMDIVRLRPGGRLHLVGRVRMATDEEAVRAVSSAGFSPVLEAFLAPGPGARPLHTQPKGSCRYLEHQPEHVRIQCRLTDEALLVMVESFCEGWSARVDGRSAELLRANVAMRALFLEAGEHQIELTFETPGLRLGFALQGLALAAIGATLAFTRARRTVHTDTPQPASPSHAA